MLEIKDLHASVDGKEVLRGLNLTVKPGEVHAIMGPNGSGKSTLAKVIAGHPAYEVTSGSVNYDINFEMKDLFELETHERAREGVFLAMQYPIEVPGVSNFSFLHTSFNAVCKHQGSQEMSEDEFRDFVTEKCKVVELKPDFLDRAVNAGFSGGEKKKNEILQMAVLSPRLAFLDETDSGLDIDALKIVADGVNKLKNPTNAIVLVTHYQRLLTHIVPDYVHVLADGQIVESGDKSLALRLEKRRLRLDQKLMDFQKSFDSFNSRSQTHEEIRRAAFAQFNRMGVPNRKNEDWKYSPAEKWVKPGLELPTWSDQKQTVDTSLSEFEHVLFFVDGEYQDAASVLPAGVKIQSLRKSSKALAHHSETFYREMKIDAFFHLNEAFTYDGVVIEVGREQVVEGVLEIVHISTDGCFVPSRNILKCGPLSQITVVERFVSAGRGYHFSNAATEIFADAGAIVRYCQTQEENTSSFHIGHINVLQNANANVETLTVSLGGGLTRFNVNSRLLGEGAFFKGE